MDDATFNTVFVDNPRALAGGLISPHRAGRARRAAPGTGAAPVGASSPATTGRSSRDGLRGRARADTDARPRGWRSSNAQTGWSPPGAASVTRMRDPPGRRALRSRGGPSPCSSVPSAAAPSPMLPQARHGLEQRARLAGRACARSPAASRSARTSPCRRAGPPRPSPGGRRCGPRSGSMPEARRRRSRSCRSRAVSSGRRARVPRGSASSRTWGSRSTGRPRPTPVSPVKSVGGRAVAVPRERLGAAAAGVASA